MPQVIVHCGQKTLLTLQKSEGNKWSVRFARGYKSYHAKLCTVTPFAWQQRVERIAVVFVFVNFVGSGKDDFKSSVGDMITTCTFREIYDGKFEQVPGGYSL